MKAIIYKRVKLIRSMQKALNQITSENDRKEVREMIDSIRSDFKGHMLSISAEDSQCVSYNNKTTNPFDECKRVRTTFRRYIRRQLCIDANRFSDKSLNQLGSLVMSKTVSEDSLDGRIKLLSGEEIVEHYSIAPAGSCMTGDDSWKVQIYADNPDVVKLVILDDHVRALLWNCDDGVTVLDRIYPSGCDAVSLLQTWAEKKGYVYRISDGRCDYSVPLSDGLNHKITLRKSANIFPYMDTFGYIEDYGDYIVASSDCDYGSFHLNSTDGGHSGLRRCSSCDAMIPEDEIHSVNGYSYCSHCFYEKYFYCAHCDTETLIDDGISVNDKMYCGRCSKTFLVRCHDCNRYMVESDAIAVYADEEMIEVCKTCFDNYELCSHCREYFPTENLTEINGDMYCDECIHNSNVESESMIA
ncbi:MAG: hypothetical protein B6D61_11945 [Bacteroidetes bacterium 4484_249]|nr:MAG: hypothetical protein B6D61_11945 [Bacteroidetes bacterium 4484_249]